MFSLRIREMQDLLIIARWKATHGKSMCFNYSKSIRSIAKNFSFNSIQLWCKISKQPTRLRTRLKFSTFKLGILVELELEHPLCFNTKTLWTVEILSRTICFLLSHKKRFHAESKSGSSTQLFFAIIQSNERWNFKQRALKASCENWNCQWFVLVTNIQRLHNQPFWSETTKQKKQSSNTFTIEKVMISDINDLRINYSKSVLFLRNHSCNQFYFSVHTMDSIAKWTLII